MSSDESLYLQTLEQYNDPVFAAEYANNIEDRLDIWTFDELLPHIPAHGKILDIGSAAGRDSGYLSEQGYQVTGIDYSSALITLAKRKYPKVEFVEGDFTKTPFEAELFDGIYCKAALVHLPSQEVVKQAVQEFYRILKSSAAILIVTKARLSEEPKTAIKVDKLSEKQRFFRYQDEVELVDLCKEAGFEIVNHRVFNENQADYAVKRDENWVVVLAKKTEKTNA